MRKLAEYTDIELIAILEASPSKRNEIFNIIYRRYSTEIFSFCVLVTGSHQTAADLCQETWIDFNKSLDKDFKIENVRNFLITIARKKTAQFFSDEKENSNITLSDDLDTTYFASMKLEQEIFNDMNYNDLNGIIEMAISHLKPELKDAFILRKLYNYDYEVVANKCKCSREVARQKVSRATESIYQLIKKYSEDFKI